MNVLLQIAFDLPPSSNKIYFRGTSLRREAREYRERFKMHAAQYFGPALSSIDPSWVFGVHLGLYFESVENPGWFTKTGKGRPKDRYKRIDLDNRIKFVTDCLRDAIGVDDSHIFESVQRKYQDSTRPRVEITLYRVNPASYGLAPEG